MAEYNLICVLCMHTPHANGPCRACNCKQFLRADVQAISGIAVMVNTLEQMHSTLVAQLYELTQLVSFAFPEARKQLDDKLQQMRAEQEAQLEAARQERLKIANEAAIQATGKDLNNLVAGDFAPSSVEPASDEVPVDSI